MDLLPKLLQIYFSLRQKVFKINGNFGKDLLKDKQGRYRLASVLDFFLIIILLFNGLFSTHFATALISPSPLQSLRSSKGGYEVFGFAPWWTFDKLQNVDFNVLTTFAYFGINVNPDGSLEKNSDGYQTFISKDATDIFQKAHSFGTRVVLTLTQMDSPSILALMDDSNAQQKAINEAVSEVKERGIDGINVDFEYTGDPGDNYRNKFTNFISNLSARMHQEVPSSRVTVSVYASAVKDPKIYNVGDLSRVSDGIFMMAYDFANSSSDQAIPTDPLYGYKDNKYWYDISTAVEDFLKYMSPNKLILGVPYYGYNYSVSAPGVQAETGWGNGVAQMYSDAKDGIQPNNSELTDYQTGWDDEGKVPYMAYYAPATGSWRMIFLDDVKSLGLKYDFAKSKNLEGVGMWALGFDSEKKELWNLLAEKFGQKMADSSVLGKVIGEVYANGSN